MSSPRVKRSHIVPKFYLRGFSQGQDQRLWVGDLRSQKTHISNVRDAAVDTSFYEEKVGPHEDNLEERLSKIESDAAPHLREFLRGYSQITPEIGRFISWLAARTCWLRREMNEKFPAYLLSNRSALRDYIGFELRPFRFENRQTGVVIHVSLETALDRISNPDWQMEVTQDQYLDMIRLQAHLFRSKHFPTLNWIRAKAPHGSPLSHPIDRCAGTF